MANKKLEIESAAEILESLGFRKGARQSTKAAFIKHLIKDAYGVEVTPPVIYADPATADAPVQLELFQDEESA